MTNEVTAAPVENVDAIALGGTAPIAHNNMSFWDLFINADIVVQLVILGMLACSIWCWSIVFKKLSTFKMVNFKSARFESTFWSGTSLEQLYEKTKGKANNHPMAEVFVAAMDEVSKAKLTASADAKSNFLARLERVMHLTKNRVADDLQNGLSVLAIIGSNMPFIGLFGTVWGIMNSFTSIASSKNISLAIVAPGIAEALFATAIGLVVAIPAVIFYNKLSNQLNRIMSRLDDFCDEFVTLISRQLDEGRL
jgi:biopolymer transport protein TolQ